MHVSQIELTNLLSHDHTLVQLPVAGLVVVTGLNGAGKSSLTECVAVACWGRTMRGTPAWRRKGDSAAGVELSDGDGVTISRQHNKRTTTLAWSAAGGLAGDSSGYPTTTKAQEALESHIGTFDVWRRSHVFSSSDAAHFSMATDAERKRLLESVLGLDRFDDALAKCRADLKKLTSEQSSAHALVSSLTIRLEAEQRRLVESEGAQLEDEPPEPTALPRADGDIGSLLRQAQADLRDAQSKARAEEQAAAAAGAGAKVHVERLRKLDDGQCPTCGQEIPDTHYDRVADAVDELVEKAKAEALAHMGQVEELRALAEELEDEVRVLQERATEARVQEQRRRSELEAAERGRAERERMAKIREDASRAAELLIQDLSAATERLTQCESQLSLLAPVERVLGLKGVRAMVLGEVLGGLEALTNDWLVQLERPDLQIRLRSYSEQKSGAVSDSISLDVEGAGEGYGYKAASGGERRRIDVAFLLALAEVASAASGSDGGTLWFDEVFDALDTDGTGAVAAALTSLARTRAVVVVTHSDALVSHLPGAKRLRVEEGQVHAL